jgi:hypothetical protein
VNPSSLPGQWLKAAFFFSALVITFIACRFNTPPSTIIPAGSPGPAPTSPPQISLDHLSINTGLAGLQSYRANLIVDFEGTRNGQPAAGRLESLTEITRDPPALYHYLKLATSLTSTEIITGASEFYRVADKVYVKRGEAGQWFTFTDGAVSPADLGFLTLERLMVLPGAVSQPPKAELLKDLKVQRYAFTERDLSAPNIIFEKATGDLWWANSGDFLAQYVISATLRLVIPDPKAHIFDQGHLTLRYTLTDINADLSITPPVDAFADSEALNKLPRLPDAQIVSVFPTFVEYTSAITPVSAALFYREQLTAQGWTENQAEIFNEKAQLTYAKEDEALTVLINPADEKDKIKVLLDLR